MSTDAGLDELAARFKYALVTLGQIDSPVERMRLFELSVKAGFVLPTIVAPSAYVSPHATIGEGAIIIGSFNRRAIIGGNGSFGET
jgi:hypothetical protein